MDLSVASQLRALRNHAERNGYLIVREYVDEAESGRVADRPQFRRMLDEAGKAEAPFRGILVWKFSRFSRKREHAVAFKSMLRRRGIRVVSITEHADDTPTGKLMEAIIESVDEFYSENLAQEVTRGMREAASRGLFGSASSCRTDTARSTVVCCTANFLVRASHMARRPEQGRPSDRSERTKTVLGTPQGNHQQSRPARATLINKG